MTSRRIGGVIAVLAIAAAFGGAAFLLAARLTQATTIDGDWCREDRSFKIDGARIRTWNGSQATGENETRSFRYQAPASDPEAGSEINMRLRPNDTVEIARPGRGSRSGEPEIWQRCRVTS